MTVDSGITVDLSGKRILVTHADRFMGPVRNYRDTHFKNSHQRSVFITFVSHGNHNLEWVSLQFSNRRRVIDASVMPNIKRPTS